MTRRIAIALITFCGVAACSVAPPTNLQPPPETRLISGYLSAHWEFPNFYPDKGLGLRVMAFKFESREVGQRYYSLTSDSIEDDATPLCLRIIGEGYASSEDAGGLYPPGKKLFVFTKLSTLDRLPNDLKCNVS